MKGMGVSVGETCRTIYPNWQTSKEAEFEGSIFDEVTLDNGQLAVLRKHKKKEKKRKKQQLSTIRSLPYLGRFVASYPSCF